MYCMPVSPKTRKKADASWVRVVLARVDCLVNEGVDAGPEFYVSNFGKMQPNEIQPLIQEVERFNNRMRMY